MLVLEHIEQIKPIFAEAHRVLRAGGELFVCELHPMRQIRGSQAEFTNRETGERERIPAFLHDTSEYVNAALGYLVNMGEWRDSDRRSDLPRLLSVRFRVSPPRSASSTEPVKPSSMRAAGAHEK
jgi:hypothetical protein